MKQKSVDYTEEDLSGRQNNKWNTLFLEKQV